MRQTRASSIRVLLALLPLACVGEIGGGAATTGRPGTGSTGGAAGSGEPRAGGADGALDPGRITLRRLNRTEYDNTVRDLLGTTLRPASAFQPDPVGFGFDNNGDVQTLTTLQIEQYQGAA